MFTCELYIFQRRRIQNVLILSQNPTLLACQALSKPTPIFLTQITLDPLKEESLEVLLEQTINQVTFKTYG